MSPESQYSTFPGKIREAAEGKVDSINENNHVRGYIAASVFLGEYLFDREVCV